MTEFARRFVSSTAAQLLPTRGHRIRKRLVRQLLPYCVVETPEGYLLLNRNYKPIGWPIEGKSRVDYDDSAFYSLVVRYPRADPGAAGLHLVQNNDGTFWFFYGGELLLPWQNAEGCRDYIARLEAFLGCKVSEEGGA